MSKLSADKVEVLIKLVTDAKVNVMSDVVRYVLSSEGTQQACVAFNEYLAMNHVKTFVEEIPFAVLAIAIADPVRAIGLGQAYVISKRWFRVREAVLVGLLIASKEVNKDDSLQFFKDVLNLIDSCCTEPRFYIDYQVCYYDLGPQVGEALGRFTHGISDDQLKVLTEFLNSMHKYVTHLESKINSSLEARGKLESFLNYWPAQFVKSLWFKWAGAHAIGSLLSMTSAISKR